MLLGSGGPLLDQDEVRRDGRRLPRDV